MCSDAYEGSHHLAGHDFQAEGAAWRGTEKLLAPSAFAGNWGKNLGMLPDR